MDEHLIAADSEEAHELIAESENAQHDWELMSEAEDEKIRMTEDQMAQEHESQEEHLVANTELDIKNKLKAASFAANEAYDLAQEAEHEANMVDHQHMNQ